MRDVGVGERRAETRYGFHVSQRMDHRVFVEAQDPQHVIDIGRQAGALCNQVEEAELARYPRVFEPEIWIEISHAIVPTKLAVVNSDPHGCGKERLRGGTDLENGLGVHRLASLPAEARSLAVDELVAG